ncbi:6-phosphogluconolactonase, partial [Acidobacteriota bacterium]
FYNLLGTQYAEKIQWNDVHLFWGDERYVPLNDTESNYAMAYELLISKIPIPKENVHPMPVNARTPAVGAEIYEKELKQHFDGIEPAEKGFTFDAVILGLGEDGHTASLFPENPALFESDKWVVHVQAPASYPTKDRLTLTFPAINISKNVFFLVSGERKRKIVDSILNKENRQGHKYPAEMVQPKGQLFWFLDI